MFQEGKVKTYNEERGFGFIEIKGESKDLFFHINDLPNNNVLPRVGEKLKFRKVKDDGKFKADHIERLNYKYLAYGKSSKENIFEFSFVFKVILMLGFVVLIVLGSFLYKKYKEYQINKENQVVRLAEEQKKIIAEQRAALGNINEQGLTEKGKKNLENPHSITRSQSAPTPRQPSTVVASTTYKCDGRTHCSQMRSYDEAVFFINNCPGTKMDGNNDGIPCERQFKR